MNECWRCEGVVLYQYCHEFTHYCVMENKNLKQKMLPSPHSLHYWAFFPAWQWRYSFSQGESHSVDMYCTQSEHSWAAVGDSVETSGAKLLIKDQSIQGGHPPGVKQDRCEQEGSRAKKGQSSIRKVLEDIRSTRRLDIFWIKPKAY